YFFVLLSPVSLVGRFVVTRVQSSPPASPSTSPPGTVGKQRGPQRRICGRFQGRRWRGPSGTLRAVGEDTRLCTPVTLISSSCVTSVTTGGICCHWRTKFLARTWSVFRPGFSNV